MAEHKTDHTRFKWLVLATLIALIIVCGTIQEVLQ